MALLAEHGGDIPPVICSVIHYMGNQGRDRRFHFAILRVFNGYFPVGIALCIQKRIETFGHIRVTCSQSFKVLLRTVFFELFEDAHGMGKGITGYHAQPHAVRHVDMDDYFTDRWEDAVNLPGEHFPRKLAQMMEYSFIGPFVVIVELELHNRQRNNQANSTGT